MAFAFYSLFRCLNLVAGYVCFRCPTVICREDGMNDDYSGLFSSLSWISHFRVDILTVQNTMGDLLCLPSAGCCTYLQPFVC